MLRGEGGEGNAKVRLPERGRHIEMSKRDGTILPATPILLFGLALPPFFLFAIMADKH